MNTWGVNKIRAPDVWDYAGYRGDGILVANIDSGVRGSHAALRDQFIGTNGWYDPAGRTRSPTDTHGHGTHTIGTIVGSGGIGVAPGAYWMACRADIDMRDVSSQSVIDCAQWLICPSRDTSNCGYTPWVVSNSWGFPQKNTFFDDVIQAWHAAWIYPVFAAGNSGPNCQTLNYPGDNSNVITVGNTNANDGLYSESSKGPSTRDGRTKPDISAPGLNVMSSVQTGDYDYEYYTGTSMSAPHVAGAIALMLSKKTMSYQDVYAYLTNNADRAIRQTGYTCGGRSENQWPNNSFGYGRLNVYRSITAFN